MKPFPEPIFVTKSIVPSLRDYVRQLQPVWSARWLTNNGEKHRELEIALKDYLEVPNLSLITNGTIALIVALRALRISGKAVTTPFTFPATVHALVWSGIEPVFCDIDDVTMTVVPDLAESLVDAETRAILPVHVYGFPADVESFDAISKRHAVAILYDGAHAFGTKINGTSIGTFGDVTMFSFHATKLFHTAEGGGLAYRNRDLKSEIDQLKNFGIVSETEVATIGTNGKMNELQAALGLEVLKMVDKEREVRARIDVVYRSCLADIDGLAIPKVIEGVSSSYQYFVIRIDAEKFGKTRDLVYEELKKFNVFSRKYFYPLCSNMVPFKDLPSADQKRLPTANRVAQEVLCLPFYSELSEEGADQISAIIRSLAGRRHH